VAVHVILVSTPTSFETQNVSNDAADPDLNHGCAYFVEEKEYKKYLSEYKQKQSQYVRLWHEHCLTDALETTCSRMTLSGSPNNPSNEHASTGTGQ